MNRCPVCRVQVPELIEDFIGLPYPGPTYNECCSKECARTMLLVDATETIATAVGGLLEHLSNGAYMWTGPAVETGLGPRSNVS